MNKGSQLNKESGVSIEQGVSDEQGASAERLELSITGFISCTTPDKIPGVRHQKKIAEFPWVVTLGAGMSWEAISSSTI